jgi:hypothetical protein
MYDYTQMKKSSEILTCQIRLPPNSMMNQFSDWEGDVGERVINLAKLV